MFSRKREPVVEPATLTIAPSEEPPSVLQFVKEPSVSETTEFSAKLKHEPSASVTSNSLIDRTVPCPLPWEKAEPTLVKVT